MKLRRIFRTVLENDCFVRANVKSLNRMGTYSFLIALVTVGRLFLYLTPAVMIIILVFVIAGAVQQGTESGIRSGCGL